MSEERESWLELARATLEAESEALAAASRRLGENLAEAVDIILAHEGKVVVSGIGKSGHIGAKLVATLCSTGTPAVFLHAAEAVHGDLGVYTPGDPSILISKSGSTGEILRLIPILRRFNSKIIAIVGNLTSTLAREADVVLDGRVTREADPLGVVPTTSSLVALGLGDALASVLMRARNFTELDFARFHPAGQIGRNLWLRVSDVMHHGEDVAWASEEEPLLEVAMRMTDRPLGAAVIVRGDRELAGVITDGDIRRALQSHRDLQTVRAGDIMAANPVTIAPQASLQDAIRLMEDRPSQLSLLPVIEPGGRRCVGLIRLHDIYQSRLA
ncbi:MAG TPA: KpsF/GutQ family sugar-phosphate isomerase [Bacteroidetes bacterium]|nr:KpsF/GutQ family sugar-phosphate isomerase [Bacteroidota bacterium]